LTDGVKAERVEVSRELLGHLKRKMRDFFGG